MSKLHFITFANTSYMVTDRIINEAKSFKMFDSVISRSERDIPEFVYKHRDFIKRNPHGYGFMLWKPKIILDLMQNINDNDIVVYCDAGMHLNVNGIPRFKQYLEAISGKKSVCAFNSSDNYRAQHYVKNDAIMSYYPQFNNEWNIAHYSGIIIIRKTADTVRLINDWLQLCETYHFIDKSLSVEYPEKPYFHGQDADNGLYNLVLAKFNDIVHNVYPDEVNIHVNNMQIIHVVKDYKQNDIDWSQLDAFPFQARRWTPSRDRSPN
jgi:hypothetical protein